MNAVLFNRRKYMAKRRPIGAPGDIADATITLSGNSFPYTGNPITPGVTVVYDGVTLVVNTDYFVGYADNTNVGAGTVTVTGTGNYVGSQIKTFQITSAVVPSWNFNLAHTLVDIQRSIYDSTATYNPTTPLGGHTAQVLTNGKIQFSSPRNGHSYIWGFSSGHEMEVSYMDSSFTSRSVGTAYWKSSLFSYDGKKFYLVYGSDNLELRQIDTSANPFVFPNDYSGATSATMTVSPNCFAISRDGSHLYYCGFDAGKKIYHRKLQTPFDVTSYSASIEAETSFDATYSVGGLTVSPDGKSIVTIGKVPFTDAVYMEKFDMTIAGDVSTATKNSEATLSRYYGMGGVAINDAGTKAIVMGNFTSEQKYVCGYTLRS